MRVHGSTDYALPLQLSKLGPAVQILATEQMLLNLLVSYLEWF